MARLDPLAPDSGLNLPRFGHAPALWLALPLLLGCALDQGWRPEIGRASCRERVCQYV